MKAVVAAFNQEKALVGAFSVITNLRMDLFEALLAKYNHITQPPISGVIGTMKTSPRSGACYHAVMHSAHAGLQISLCTTFIQQLIVNSLLSNLPSILAREFEI